MRRAVDADRTQVLAGSLAGLLSGCETARVSPSQLPVETPPHRPALPHHLPRLTAAHPRRAAEPPGSRCRLMTGGANGRLGGAGPCVVTLWTAPAPGPLPRRCNGGWFQAGRSGGRDSRPSSGSHRSGRGTGHAAGRVRRLTPTGRAAGRRRRAARIAAADHPPPAASAFGDEGPGGDRRPRDGAGAVLASAA